MTVRLLGLLALVVTLASPAAVEAERGGSSRRAVNGPVASSPDASAPHAPGPLSGVPLTGPTGLRFLVASDPPFFLNVDTGRIKRLSGLNVRGNPVLSVLAVGKDAVVWLDRRRSTSKLAAAEIYAVRHGSQAVVRIATGWDLAPATDGHGIWVKRFIDGRHCTLAEIGLDGRQRRSARPLPCSTRLIASGSVPLLVQGRSLVDPLSGRKLPPLGGWVWAIAGELALAAAGSHGPLVLTDLRSGERWRLAWPSRIGGPGTQGGKDQAVAQPDERLLALDFADPAYQGDGTQVADFWLLDPSARRLQHLPDMPAAVWLKSTSMSWTSDGRLVMLAATGRHDVVAVWRPGAKRIAVRRVRLPVRDSGSDAFVVW